MKASYVGVCITVFWKVVSLAVDSGLLFVDVHSILDTMSGILRSVARFLKAISDVVIVFQSTSEYAAGVLNHVSQNILVIISWIRPGLVVRTPS